MVMMGILKWMLSPSTALGMGMVPTIRTRMTGAGRRVVGHR